MAEFDSQFPHLPEDSEALRVLVQGLLRERDQHKQQAEEQRQKAAQLQAELLHLQLELERYKRWYYGPRADRLHTAGELAQLLLQFAEELEQQPVAADERLGLPTEPDQALRRVKRRKGRRDLARFENLPVTTHVYELNEAERACPGCGQERNEIGAEESWQVEYVPGRFERIQHVRKKYACARCESQGESPCITAAHKPETVIDKGLAGPGLLAYIVTSKYAEYVPLYRLEEVFARQGFEISRATQSVWCGDVADLIEPLYKVMAERVRASHVVATDDTILPMLSKGKTANARMWVYVGDASQPYNIFDFTLHRGRDGPLQFLKEYDQVLVADAYGGYNGVVTGNRITRAGCWAHLRRKFIDAEKAAPEIAREAVERVRALYAIERQGQTVTVEERLRLRQEKAAPLLAELRLRLLAWKEQLLPRHPMAEAIQHAFTQWNELNVFCRDGAVPIDNNISEREMKRIVLNRKNSLFVGNPRGGRTAAILASITSTCRRHDIDPQRYLTQLLLNLPGLSASQLVDWLPDRWKRQQAAPPINC
ncbi:MAG TPA: IS66 family transposase [Bryobacteraceae bacterium]|nr:IS66 family transposase [Bryobacteraceae bacterium]